MVDAEAKREAGVVEVDLSLESLERRVEERLNEKVNFLLERLDTAVQVSKGKVQKKMKHVSVLAPSP